MTLCAFRGSFSVAIDPDNIAIDDPAEVVEPVVLDAVEVFCAEAVHVAVAVETVDGSVGFAIVKLLFDTLIERSEVEIKKFHEDLITKRFAHYWSWRPLLVASSESGRGVRFRSTCPRVVVAFASDQPVRVWSWRPLLVVAPATGRGVRYRSWRPLLVAASATGRGVRLSWSPCPLPVAAAVLVVASATGRAFDLPEASRSDCGS